MSRVPPQDTVPRGPSGAHPPEQVARRRADPFAGLSPDERRLLRPAPLPERVEPMLAVLTEERFSDPGWIFERKLDGIRCIAIAGKGRVRLRSRNDLSLDGRFPEVAGALGEAAAVEAVLDGEVVAFDGARTSFARLQQRGEHPAPVFYYVFDVLHLAGNDVTALPLRARKRLLRRALRPRPPVRLTPHRNRDGEALYPEACRRGTGAPETGSSSSATGSRSS